jgi:serine protease Do
MDIEVPDAGELIAGVVYAIIDLPSTAETTTTHGGLFMRKSVWIALAGFAFGVLLAGYIFVYLPEKKAEAKSFLEQSSHPLGANLFAEVPQAKPMLDFVTVSERIGPTVVRIDAERLESAGGSQGAPFDEFWDRFFGAPQRPRGQQPQQEPRAVVQGTGFFISADGYIVTNNHIVERSTKVTVYTISGEEYTAKVIGTDPQTDVALIKVEVKNAPFAELGDSAAVKVGEWVLAVGNPLGMEHTVTAGIVSAKSRQLGIPSDTPIYEDFIQTDAAINRGNSGGPLVNMKGEVIGINSNILTPSGGNIGIGFAIPSSMAKKVVIQLKEKGKVVRGRLGISIAEDINPDTQKSLNLKSLKGALVNSVEAGLPADKAGLKPYDVIIGVNGQPVENRNDLRMKIADLQPGTKVEIKYVRDGKEMTTTATIVELETAAAAKPAAEKSGASVGLTVEALTPATARRYGLRTNRGLLITEVAGGSAAARRNLSPGDIIIEANRQKIETIGLWETVLKGLKPGDPLMLLIRRETDGGEAQDFIVTLRLAG